VYDLTVNLFFAARFTIGFSVFELYLLLSFFIVASAFSLCDIIEAISLNDCLHDFIDCNLIQNHI